MVSITRTSEKNRDSCYFPGCRKHANCSCEICLASINATRDLLPASSLKSSLTRLSPAKDKPEVTPVSFGSLSTPTSRSTRPLPSPRARSPRLQSSAITQFMGKPSPKPRAPGSGGFAWVLLALVLIVAAEFAPSRGAFGVLKPVFTSAAVRHAGEGSQAVKGLNGKLKFLQSSLRNLGVADRRVSNCSFADSKWEISQVGLLLNSHCKLYKSPIEEIRIWGWPLQTAGLLVTGVSSRSFTVISGRVTEWPEGKIGFVTREANSSWASRRWGSSLVQLDRNTWVLEYRRSPFVDNPRLVSAGLSVAKHRVWREVEETRKRVWVKLFWSSKKYPSVRIPPPT